MVYVQMIETEVGRRIRKEPATALEVSLVGEEDALEELWTIG